MVRGETGARRRAPVADRRDTPLPAAQNQDRALQDLSVLVVEDEALVALSIEQTLFELGCRNVSVAFRVEQALRMAEEGGHDVAILDVNVAGCEVFPVADALVQRGVPILFATGYGPEAIRADLRHHPVIGKPYQPRDISETIQRLRAGTP